MISDACLCTALQYPMLGKRWESVVDDSPNIRPTLGSVMPVKCVEIC